MIESPAIAASLGFALAGAVALALTPVARSIAHRLEVLDHPGGYKVQSSPVPYLGGMAVVVAITVVMLGAAVIAAPERSIKPLVLTLMLAIGLAAMGLVDDLFHLSPRVKLAGQAAAAAAVWAGGIHVSLFGGALDFMITVVWIVGVTNAFNLLDNMDGLSAGVVGISGVSLACLAFITGQFLVAALAGAIAGAASGFLRYNISPATIYMGDAGSLFFGFLLALVGLRLEFTSAETATWFIAPLALAVPLLDTSMVTITRVLRGTSPFRGGRDHLSHRLVALGLSVRSAVGVLYMAAVLSGVVAVVVSLVSQQVAIAVACMTTIVLVSAVVWLVNRGSLPEGAQVVR